MDRKIKKKAVSHKDKPGRQRWLYEMLEWGFAKAMLIIWLITMGVIVLTLVSLKLVFGSFK